MEYEALIHRIEDALAARNRNWNKIETHMADFESHQANFETHHRSKY